MNSNTLLKNYDEEQNHFYFSTPEYEILTKNSSKKILFEHATELPQIISEMKEKKQIDGKIIVGAIPFDIKEGGALYVVDSWEKRELPFEKRADIALLQEKKNSVIEKKQIPSPKTYMEMVKKGVEHIKAGELNKIVLSRGIELTFEDTPNVCQVLQRLYKSNSDGYTYALNLEGGNLLLGASPEMLVSKRGDNIYSNPLAGSRPRGRTLTEDRELALELEHSEKDLLEHKFVVDNIVEKITGICKHIKAFDKPELIHTKQLWHLSSVITGELVGKDKTVIDAALAIHPTPAICGVPQSEAYKKILELEGQSRGVFTGIIGWCDENGDGDWAIAIRGGELKENKMYIRAGAGIVLDSIPEEEMKETGVKLKTMLSTIHQTEE